MICLSINKSNYKKLLSIYRSIKTMKNNTINLSTFGYAGKYVINENGEIYNQERNKKVEIDKNNRVFI